MRPARRDELINQYNQLSSQNMSTLDQPSFEKLRQVFNNMHAEAKADIKKGDRDGRKLLTNLNEFKTKLDNEIKEREKRSEQARKEAQNKLDQVIKLNQQAAKTKDDARSKRRNTTTQSTTELETRLITSLRPIAIDAQLMTNLIESQMQQLNQEELELAIQKQGVLRIKALVDNQIQILSISLSEGEKNPNLIASDLLKIWSSSQSIQIEAYQIDTPESQKKIQGDRLYDEWVIVKQDDAVLLEGNQELEKIDNFLLNIIDTKQKINENLVFFLPLTAVFIALNQMINQFYNKFNLSRNTSQNKAPIAPTIQTGSLQEVSVRMLAETAQGDDLSSALVNTQQAIHTSSLNAETRQAAEENLTFIQQQIERITQGSVTDVVAVYENDNGEKQVLFVNLAELLKNKPSIENKNSLYQAIYQASEASGMMTFRYLNPIEAQLFQRVASNDASGERIFNALTRYEPETGLRVQGDRLMKFAKMIQDAINAFKNEINPLPIGEITSTQRNMTSPRSIARSNLNHLVEELEATRLRFIQNGGYVNDIMDAVSNVNDHLEDYRNLVNPAIIIEETQAEQEPLDRGETQQQNATPYLDRLYSALESLKNALYRIVQMAYDYVYKPVSDVIKAGFFSGSNNNRQVQPDTSNENDIAPNPNPSPNL